MTKNCRCIFHNAIISHISRNRAQLDAAFASSAAASLIEDAEACCGLAILLFLVFCCEDVPAFLAEMRSHLLTAYGGQSDA